MRKANVDRLLARGVWQAPWFGPNGELVLIAVTRDMKLAAPPLVVPDGGSRLLAADTLWDQLERDDPIPNLKLV